MKNLYFGLLLLFICPNLTNAQTAKWEIGPMLLSGNYMGDMVSTAYPTLEGNGWGGGIFLRRNYTERLSLRLNAAYGTFKGADANFADRLGVRGFSFEGSAADISLLGEWDLRGKKRYKGGNFHKMLSPYIMGGIGLGYIDPTTSFNNTIPETPGMVEDRKGDFSQIVPVLPFGGGIRYDFSPKVTLAAELGLRMTFSDYVDGVSKSADPSDNDWYLFTGLSLAYRFGRFKDSDGDRIIDRYDHCPNIQGEPTLAGCPDTDGDGVIDEKDQCPYQRGASSMNGCPDKDGDGVADKDDRCPETIGLRALKGCPDSDADSIPDIDDACPDRMGFRYSKGCPDTDRDSIADAEDKCPTEKGLAVNQGCPDRDTDGDGVVDRLDQCPDRLGMKIFDGCPDGDGDGIPDRSDACPDKPGLTAMNGCPDSDGDGIADREDTCPDKVGPKTNKGCPEVAKEELKILEKAMTGVQFDPSKATLRKVSFPILDNVADLLKKYPNYNLAINGHTDSDGDEKKNQTLSEQRAKACLDYLVTKGISASRMTSKGFGESQPLVPNTNKANKAQNRRVEFVMAL
jgi:OmpA-OmpF porin, OOP family